MPAERGAADVEPDGPGVRGGVQLLAQVRRRDGREPGQRHALSSSRSPSSADQVGASAQARATTAEPASEAWISRVRPITVGQRSGDQQREPEPERWSARRRACSAPAETSKSAASSGQHGLGAVEERERGQTRREQGDDDPPVVGAAGPVAAVGRGRAGGSRWSPGALCARRGRYVQCRVLRRSLMRQTYAVTHADPGPRLAASPSPTTVTSRRPRPRSAPASRPLSRALARVEAELGARLFERLPDGDPPDRDRRAGGRGGARPHGALPPAAERPRPGARPRRRRGPARVPRLAGHLAGPGAARAPSTRTRREPGSSCGRSRRTRSTTTSRAARSTSPSARRGPTRRTAGTTLQEERLVLVVPPRHRLPTRRRVSLAELAGEELVTTPPGFGHRSLVDGLLREAGVAPPVSFESQDLATIDGLVAAGLGVAVVPEAFAGQSRHGRGGDLRRGGAAHDRADLALRPRAAATGGGLPRLRGGSQGWWGGRFSGRATVSPTRRAITSAT